jgi:hypothetical protein
LEEAMKKPMIASGRLTYGTRRLVAGEPFEATRRDARVLAALGKARPVPLESDPLDHDGDGRKGGSESGGPDLKELRAEYQAVVGKRAFAGWDAETLREKIAAAR